MLACGGRRTRSHVEFYRRAANSSSYHPANWGLRGHCGRSLVPVTGACLKRHRHPVTTLSVGGQAMATDHQGDRCHALRQGSSSGRALGKGSSSERRGSRQAGRRRAERCEAGTHTGSTPMVDEANIMSWGTQASGAWAGDGAAHSWTLVGEEGLGPAARGCVVSGGVVLCLSNDGLTWLCST